MKLLIFSPYYPPHIGGLESHADEFNKYLSRRGMDITVFTPRLPLDSPEIETKFKQEFKGVHPVKSGETSPAKQEFNKVKIIRFPAFEIISNYPLPKFWSCKFWKLFFSLFKQDFDLTISRTRFFVTSLMALVYAKIKKTRWIHIEHGSDFVQLSSKFKSLVAKIYDYTFGWLIFKCSDLNISISQAVQKFIYKFDKRYSPVIYRGLNFDKFDKIQSDSVIHQKYKNKIIITFVGRLYKWKGVENSIKAIRSLPINVQKQIVFLIIGDGEDHKKLKEKIGNNKNIKMLGYLSQEKTLSILKTSDIYIHSAYPGGGLSTSLLEAMYAENIIIATPNEGANEIIQDKHNGILIKKSDPKNIQEAILKIIENKLSFNKFSTQAKETIKEKINWEKSIQKYETEFKKILARK